MSAFNCVLNESHVFIMSSDLQTSIPPYAYFFYTDGIEVPLSYAFQHLKALNLHRSVVGRSSNFFSLTICDLRLWPDIVRHTLRLRYSRSESVTSRRYFSDLDYSIWSPKIVALHLLHVRSRNATLNLKPASSTLSSSPQLNERGYF